MSRYALLLLAAMALGCGRSGSPTAAPATPAPAGSLPPEVEHDPETATRQYQKNKAPKR